MTRRLLLDWKLTTRSGWGNYGVHFALAALRHGWAVVPLLEPDVGSLTPTHRRQLAPVLGAWSTIARLYAALGPTRGAQLDGVRVTAFGNQFAHSTLPSPIVADAEIGLVFFEDAALSPAALARARQCRTIIAGSSWNARVLRDAGLPSVSWVMQGVDTAVFSPGPRDARLADRFVVFSGGKLEYRKGQDIVVAAFREFRARHPDALLLHAWHNPWPETAATIGDGGHVDGAPAVEAGRFAFGPWLARHGIAAEAHAEVPPLPNAELGAVVRLADVAVFPNRCEGGTNLVAMECMAAGVPVLLSDTTGHRDLLDPGRTMPLPTHPLHAGAPAYAAWGEVPVPALVEALEVARQERAAAHARAAAAAAWMRHVDWARQMDRVMELVADAADTRTYPADLRRAGGC